MGAVYDAVKRSPRDLARNEPTRPNV